jgi:hypothetical protein
MSFLYRHALFVSRNQPYLDWANSLQEEGAPDLTEEISRGGRTVYLVPEVEGEPELGPLVDEFWEQIFETELSAWIMNEERWPKPLSRDLFDAWFDVELNAAVYDLTPDEPLTQAQVDTEDLADAIAHCAWCGIEVDESAGRFAEFRLADRSRFAWFEGRVLPLTCGETEIPAMVTYPDSEPARAGADVLVRVCSSRCERIVRKLVPKALRRLAVKMRGATSHDE